MSSFADYWENKILNHVFGKDNYIPPIIYVGLSIADPLDDASRLAEPNGNAYSRVQTSVSDWDTASGGSLINVNAIVFPQAIGDWGTITHFALFDSIIGGNMLVHGAISQSKTIYNKNAARFEAGNIMINLQRLKNL